MASSLGGKTGAAAFRCGACYRGAAQGRPRPLRQEETAPLDAAGRLRCEACFCGAPPFHVVDGESQRKPSTTRACCAKLVSMRQTIYEAAGGRQAFMNLARAWHARCLADAVVSHAFSHGYHPQHSERLAAYWAEALGGPSDYTKSMGDQSSVVRMHSGNGEHLEMDERAQICFAQALDDAALPDDAHLRTTLKAYFRWATAAMAAYPKSAEDVPAGFPVARWSWDGPA